MTFPKGKWAVPANINSQRTTSKDFLGSEECGVSMENKCRLQGHLTSKNKDNPRQVLREQSWHRGSGWTETGTESSAGCFLECGNPSAWDYGPSGACSAEDPPLNHCQLILWLNSSQPQLLILNRDHEIPTFQGCGKYSVICKVLYKWQNFKLYFPV